MATIASNRKLNAKSIKDKYSALKEVEDNIHSSEKQRHKSLQSTEYQKTLYLLD